MPLVAALTTLGLVVGIGALTSTAEQSGSGTIGTTADSGRAVAAGSAVSAGVLARSSATATDATPAVPLAPDLCREYGTVRRVDSLAPVILQQRGESGDRVHADIVECRFYAPEGVARLKIVVGWNGSFTSTPYALSGDLVLTRDQWAFNPGAGNDNLNNLDGTRKQAVGALALLGLAVAAASEPASEPPSTAPAYTASAPIAVCLANESSQTIHFAWRQTAAGAGWRADSLPGLRSYRFSSSGVDTVQVSLNVSLAPTNDQRQFVLPMSERTATRCDHSGYYIAILSDTIHLFSYGDRR